MEREGKGTVDVLFNGGFVHTVYLYLTIASQRKLAMEEK